MSHSLVAGFVRSAKAFPDRPALEVNDHTFTYAELAQKANRFARSIKARRPGGQPFAALFAYRSATAYAGALGILLSGRGYVPLNPRFPAARTQKMLDLSGADVLVVGAECEKSLSSLLEHTQRALLILLPEESNPDQYASAFPRHTFVRADEAEKPAVEVQAPDVDAGDPAYLLFTSGSTGTPKGVAVSHCNVRAYIDYVTDRYQISEDDRFSQMFDMTFDLSVHDLFVCWERGACLCSVPEASMMAPSRFIREKRLTVWFSVPSVGMMMGRLRMLKPDRFPTLRLSLFCGEALPASVAEQWQAAAPNSVLENLYGPTEATIAITHYRWDVQSSPQSCVNGIVPIGHIFDGHTAYLHTTEASNGTQGEGELCLAGPQVTAGYLNNPQKTAEHFIRIPALGEATWYRTGDLVSRDETGCMYFLGRIDNQVKVRGHRVELQEVDHVLRQAADSDMVATVAWPVRDGHAEGLVAFIAEKESSSVADLLSFCKERLPEYMVPHRIHHVDEFPLNANGKVDRKQLCKNLDERVYG